MLVPRTKKLKAFPCSSRFLSASLLFLLLFALSVSVADPVGPFLNHVELTLNGAYGNTTFSDYVIILQKDVPYELPGDIRSIRFYFLGGPTRDPTIIQVGIYDGFKFLDRFDFRGIRQNDPRSFPAISSSLFNQRSNSSLTIALRTGVVGPVRQVSGTVSVEPNPPVREYYSLAINDQVIGDYRITLNAIVSSADSTRIRFNSIRNNMGVFEQRPSVQDHCVLYLRSVNLHSFPTFYHSDLHFVDDVHHGTMRSNYHDGRSIPFTLRRHVLAAGELEPIYGLRMSTRIQDTVTGEDIYRLDIDLDVEGLIEEKEENPGGLLLIGETLSISLNISESLIAARGRLTVKLDSGADRVLLSVPGRSEPAFTSRTWKLGTDAVPTRLTVKGVRPSTNPRDVSIQLIYRSPDGNYSYDTVKLSVFDRIALAVDRNRDGDIEFKPPDSTSRKEPLVFWFNNDRDSGSEADAEDLYLNDLLPELGLPDSLDHIINSIRDLEDFTRLHLHLPAPLLALLKSGAIQAYLTFKSNPPGTAINLYQAVVDEDVEDGSRAYLNDPKVAENQLEMHGKRLAQIRTGGSYRFPLDYWKRFPKGQRFVHFLIEGVDTIGGGFGSGELILELRLPSGKLISTSSALHLQLWDIKHLYQHWSVGDHIDRDPKPNAEKISGLSHDALKRLGFADAEKSLILFVHGWRLRPWERRYYAETAFKRLYHQGYQGAFILFSWPTEWINEDIGEWAKIRIGFSDSKLKDYVHQYTGNYNRSELRAWNSAFPLMILLHRLKKQGYQVHVLAHSMGNVVVSEALRHYKRRLDRGLEKGTLIANYAASQAATPAHAYDARAPILGNEKNEQVRKLLYDIIPQRGDIVNRLNKLGYLTLSTPEVYGNYPPPRGRPYFSGIDKAAENIFNFHNQNDLALAMWLLNQRSKPDRGWNYNKRRKKWYRRKTELFLTDARNRDHKDRYEIFSFIAEAHGRPLGSEEKTRGVIQEKNRVDLNDKKTFGYGKGSHEHSAQFLGTNMSRCFYWVKLLEIFEFDPIDEFKDKIKKKEMNDE